MNKTLGNFTGLAGNYSKYRPAYSPFVLDALLGLVNKPLSEINFADVGAGTGIWTRMVASRNIASAVAIEPNEDMRQYGINDSLDFPVKWIEGNGENTTLNDNSLDLLTMASSFHWVDFDNATKEFTRVLRNGGIFCALWNPRLIEVSPLLQEIENKLYEIAPHIKRVSSGRTPFTDSLTKQLDESALFEDVIYLEGHHKVKQTPNEYIGVWGSVNDIRAQAGEKLFAEFMGYVEDRVKNIEHIETTYQTRAWVARVSK